MSINGININSKISPVQNTGQESVGAKNPLSSKGPSFQHTLEQLQKSGNPGVQNINPGALKFSSHAVERMQTRGVNFGPEQMQKLNSAVEKARAKGAKETLVLADNAALIVSVKNNTVVTVMDSQALKENVFTNIDSTVVI